MLERKWLTFVCEKVGRPERKRKETEKTKKKEAGPAGRPAGRPERKRKEKEKKKKRKKEKGGRAGRPARALAKKKIPHNCFLVKPLLKNNYGVIFVGCPSPKKLPKAPEASQEWLGGCAKRLNHAFEINFVFLPRDSTL